VIAATAWEVGIKASLGRLALPDTVKAGIEDSGFEKLQISCSHAEAAAALPPHHGDLFDRMLVAHAVSEDLTVVTHDRKLAAYDVIILWT
jgi:PIN domain nuclease of toxin-antitoxin system